MKKYHKMLLRKTTMDEYPFTHDLMHVYIQMYVYTHINTHTKIRLYSEGYNLWPLKAHIVYLLPLYLP